jgi:hypothetical protein
MLKKYKILSGNILKKIIKLLPFLCIFTVSKYAKNIDIYQRKFDIYQR